MLRSMTGYGTGNYTRDGYSFTVDAKSINHRYLDSNLRLPRELHKLEEKIRSLINEKLNRGRIEISIDLQAEDGQNKEIEVDEDIARSYLTAIRRLEALFELEKSSVTADDLLHLPEIVGVQRKQYDLDKLWEILKRALDAALDELVIQRKREGERLEKDLKQRLEKVSGFIANIKKRAPVVVDEYRNRLELRIEELLTENIDENRLLAEVTLLAERSSITEEVVRLESHVVSFTETTTQAEPVGRKLDFILQEMFREINTVGSKANDSAIARLVVETKSELEKMREQVQNVE